MKLLLTNEDNKCKISAIISKEDINNAFDELLKSSTSGKPITQSFSEQLKVDFIEKASNKAISEFGIQPVGSLTFEGALPERDNEFKFVLKTEVLPQIDLPKKIEKVSVDVKESPFDPVLYQQYILRLQRSKGKGEEVKEKRLPKDGDVVIIEYSASYEKEPILGMEKQRMSLTLTPQYQMKPEFADLVRQLHVDESATISLNLPSHFPNKKLQNKEVEYTIQVKKIIKEDLPKVDDAFAKSLHFKDLKDMQVSVTKEIFKYALSRCQQEAEEKLLTKLIDGLDFVPPSSLVKIHEKEYLMQTRFFYSNLGLSEKEIDDKIKNVMSECKENALFLAKRQAYLMSFGYSKKIIVTDQDINNDIQKIASSTKQNVEQLKDFIFSTNAIYELQDKLLADKALKLLYSSVSKNIIPAENAV